MSIHFLKRKFIPSHNADLDAIEELKKVSFEITGPYAMEILEWIQDPNWAVAHPIIDYFKPYRQKLNEEFLSILNSEENSWKKVVLEAFFLDWEKDSLAVNISAKLQRIAYSPSIDETQMQLDLLAQKIVEELTSESLNNIRFELKFSSNLDQQKIWDELQQQFPQLKQLSAEIGEIQSTSDVQELYQLKTYFIKKLSELQDQSKNGFKVRSRYHSNKP
jgi:hypothetical protein